MNKAVIKELYERTNLYTLPKKIRKEVFGVLNLGSIESIDDNLIDIINSKVNEIIQGNKITLTDDELELFQLIGAGMGYSITEKPKIEAINYSLSIFKEYYGRDVLPQDLIEVEESLDNQRCYEGNMPNIKTTIFGLRILEDRVNFIKDICEYIGIDFDIKRCLEGALFYKIMFDDSIQFTKYSHIRVFFEELQNIDGFIFEGIFDIDFYSLRRGSSFSYILDIINHFGIKNIKDLNSEGISRIIECDDQGNFAYFKNIEELKDLENTLGIKLTLDDLKFDYIIDFFSIKNHNYFKELDRKNKLGYFSSILHYFSLNKFENLSYNFIELVYKLITLVKSIVDSVEEDILIKTLIEYCEQLTGMRITGDNINDENVDTLLVNLAIELGKGQYHYETFFTKFPNNSYINKDGDKEEKKWQSDNFYMGGAYWVMSGNNETENIEFINLFLDELNTIDDINNNRLLSQFANLPQGVKRNIINFIGLLSRHNIIQVELESINIEFIDFVKTNFGTRKVTSFLKSPEGFFDNIESYRDFGKGSIENNLLIYESKLFGNLKNICTLYDFPINISSFREIEEKFEDTYGNMEEFYQFMTAHILDSTIDFIYNKGPKNISYENLIYILVFQGQLRIEIGMHQTDDVDEKEELLISEFGLNRNHYFRKDKDGNYEINRDKKWLLSLLFDKRLSYNDLLNFTKQFLGLTLGKLVKFYRDSDLRICIPSYEREIFLIQYAIDHNDFYYIKHNIEILEKLNNDLNFEAHLEYRDHRENIEETYIRLDILLDKTGGFLTTTFVKNFVRKGCGEDELDKLIKSYNDTSEQLLGSDVLELDEVDENVAEAVFMAYRPTKYSLDEIVHKLSYELQDNTEHLSKVKYKKEGYKKSIFRSSKELKDGEKLDVKGIGKIEEGILELSDKEEEFNIRGFDFKRFFTNSTNLEDLMPIVREIYMANYDSRIMEYRNNMGDSNYDYTRLQRLSSIFGVITKDSFESEENPIISYISSLLSFEELKEIFLRLRKIKDNKFRKLFEEYFKNEYLEDEAELRNCLTQIFYEQLKVIASRLKKEINKELKKFGNSKGDGEEIRFNLCKNIASYFAMAGSGLCTDGDMERHNEERYLPVNIVNENSKKIIGMLMLYVEEDKDYLVVRGFNLRDELYSIYDMGSIAESMVDFIKDFAMENGRKKIYIPEHSGQHLVSNSSGLTKGIQKISLKNKDREWYKKQEKFEGGRIGQGGGFTVENLYMLLDL